MKHIFVLILAIMLSGCSLFPTKEAPPRIVQVKVPVIVDCLGELPVKPRFIKDAELLLLNGAGFVNALHIDRLERDMYIAQLEAAIEGCKTSQDNLESPR